MIPIRDENPYKNKPYMTWFLIISSFAVYIFQMTLPYEELEALVLQYGFVPENLSALLMGGDLSMLKNVLISTFACMFLHGSLVHLLGNMWSLWLFGDNVEDKIGRVNFLVFYIFCGIAATLAHYFFNTSSTFPVIGASGAIAGVMGAYVLLFPLAKIVTLIPIIWIPFFFNIPAFIFIGLWFLLQVFLGISEITVAQVGGGVAWWAHVGGFLFGIVFIKSYKNKN